MEKRQELTKIEELRFIDDFALEEALKLPPGIQLDVLVTQCFSRDVYTDSSRDLIPNVLFELERGRRMTPMTVYVVRQLENLALLEYNYTGGMDEGYHPSRENPRFGGITYSDYHYNAGAMKLLYGESILQRWKMPVEMEFHGEDKLTLSIGGKDYGTGIPSMIICHAILKTFGRRKFKKL